MSHKSDTTQSCLSIPIYDADVWIVVAQDIGKERKEWEDLMGPAPPDEDYDALCSHNGGATFALFFAKKRLCRKTVEHEIFHLTHRIFAWVGAPFVEANHEPAALLHAYLTETIFSELRKMKLNI
jgi:hypothetical protein